MQYILHRNHLAAFALPPWCSIIFAVCAVSKHWNINDTERMAAFAAEPAGSHLQGLYNAAAAVAVTPWMD